MLFALEKGCRCPVQTFDGYIHSVFNKAINIVTDSTATPWLSLLDSSLPNTPCGIKVELASQPLFQCFQHGERVYFRAGILRFASYSACNIDTRSAIRWLSPPAIQHANRQRLLVNYRHAENYFVQYINRQYQPNLYIQSYSDYLTYLGISITHDLLNQPEIIAQNIGKGDGLTPSGDDFICGLFAALYLAEAHDCRLTETLRQLTETCQIRWHQTTDVSRHYLMQAASGDFSQPVLWFIYSLFNAEEKHQIEARLNNVLEIGSSSGADIISGILFGTKLLFSK